MLIRTRLALALVAILVVAMTIFSIVTYEVTRSSLTSDVRREVQLRADAIVAATWPAHGTTALRLPRLNVFTAPDTYIQIRSANGTVLKSSGNLEHRTLPILPAAIRAHQVQEVKVGGLPLVLCERPIIVGGRVSAYVLVGQTPHQIYLALGQLRNFLYPATAIALLLAAATVWILVWWSMRPLERLDAAAAEISSTRDHTRRVKPGKQSDEIGRLSLSINTMLSALEDAYRQVQNVSELQRHFLADVSHELRRPLTIMLSSLDILTRIGGDDPSFQAQTLADMRIEVDRMARMVTQLLILARTDSSATMSREPIFLVDVLTDACRQGQPMGDRTSLVCSGLDRLDGVLVHGNVDYLQQLFLILLDNAFKYTGGEGQVDVIAAPNGKTVDVIVADTGPGIPPDDLEHIFDRFYRASTSRRIPGMGLGLSIARHIVEQHGGAIAVESTVGSGSRFTVKLPLLGAES
jgi:two-component system OmpR family sensor kinase